MLEQAKQIIEFHKEKCFKCGEIVEKGENGVYNCKNCGFEFANLFMKRIPVNTFLTFKEIADKEFCSDYGMAFKSIIDKITDGTIGLIMEIFQELEQRLSKLENKPAKEIKTLSGRIIKGGRENGKI